MISKLPLAFRLLTGRLLTRFGDQAWDFAVPIILLKILPNHLRIAALYYLIVRFLSVLVVPRLASVIDTKDRRSVVRIGLVLQFVGVLLSATSVYVLWSLKESNPSFENLKFLGAFSFMVASGLIANLGATLMDIAISNDLAPSVFSGTELSKFNSRFRQIDLLAEVGAPVIAGLLLALPSFWMPLTGFALIAAWNLISFFPEFSILHSVFNDRPDLKEKPISTSADFRKSFLRKLIDGWREFFRQPVAPVMIAYALLWLSVLSPHGVLLTGFLKDGWQVPEWMIGLFRGSGAFFGLAATALFPFALKFMSVRKVSGIFLLFQTAMVLAALGFFYLSGTLGQIGFLVLILLSRIGLYGFSLGEMQIRQERIPARSRGEVNGFANALTGIATLVLFGAGATLPSTEEFKYLVLMSVSCVLLALVIYGIWLRSSKGSEQDEFR